MKLIEGGKEKRLRRARELMMLAVMKDDDYYFDQVLEMARQDGRRADLRLVTHSSGGGEAHPPRSEPPFPHR
jgi:hypothetical protein